MECQRPQSRDSFELEALNNNPIAYTYMMSQTGLTFISARENPQGAYAEYIGRIAKYLTYEGTDRLLSDPEHNIYQNF